MAQVNKMKYQVYAVVEDETGKQVAKYPLMDNLDSQTASADFVDEVMDYYHKRHN